MFTYIIITKALFYPESHNDLSSGDEAEVDHLGNKHVSGDFETETGQKMCSGGSLEERSDLTSVELEFGCGMCHCPCCNDIHNPHQPKNLEKSRMQQVRASQGREEATSKSYSRAIQTSWYARYSWISVCTSSYKIFCFICRSAQSLGLITFSRHQKSTFTYDGFNNWKKAMQRFDEHEKSAMHREAVMKIAARSSSINVGAQLSKQHEADTKSHRRMLLKLLASIRYLARQGLAFRGHHEDSVSLEGNLYQLLLLQAHDDPVLSQWMKEREYISPTIVNEIITLMGHTILRQLLADISSSHIFSLIADEATDISRNEQLCIAIRWVDSEYNIHETALGLVQLPNTKALTLFGLIKDMLIRCSLQLSECIGQAYDGASNMSGIHNGVQALMKREAGHCLYVHCFGHCLNLCVQEVTKKCELLRNTMEFIFELVQLIKFSPKRLNLFENIRQQVALCGGEGASSPSLRTLCPTRWTVRHGSINSILSNYRTLITTLDTVQQGHDEYAAKAKGLLARLESFELFFGLKLAYLVYSATEQLSVNLQAKDTTVSESLKGSCLLVQWLKSMRNEAAFETFHGGVVKASEGLTDEPVLPRYRKPPRRLDAGGQPHRYDSPKDRYRHAYYEVLELASGEVSRRFDQSDVGLIQETESLLLRAANGENIPSIPQPVSKYFDRVDPALLKVQLLMLPDAIRTAHEGTPITIKKVTNLRTLAETLNRSEIYKGMLTEVDKVLRAYFTFPVTSATAERSFSSLRRIKTFLRSTMTQERLNNLFLLYVHSERTDALDLVATAKEFVAVNKRRMNYFGKF